MSRLCLVIYRLQFFVYLLIFLLGHVPISFLSNDSVVVNAKSNRHRKPRKKQYSIGYHPFRLVKVVESSRSNSKTSESIYLLTKDVVRQVPHHTTLHAFGLESNDLPYYSFDNVEGMKYGPPVPVIDDLNIELYDVWINQELVKSQLIQGQLTVNVSFVGKFANPAIARWQDRLLLATGSNWGQSNVGRSPMQYLTFQWINDVSYPLEDRGPYKCINTYRPDNLTNSVTIRGEDPRIVTLSDDRFNVYFTNPMRKNHVRMGMAKMSINSTTGCVEVDHLYENILPTTAVTVQQKNWSPFQYKNDVLLIQSINPFIVVNAIEPTEEDLVNVAADVVISHAQDQEQLRLQSTRQINSKWNAVLEKRKWVDGLESHLKKWLTPKDSAYLLGKVVSNAGLAELHWPFGMLRGGTNAIRLKSSKYLAFFHSAIRREHLYPFTDVHLYRSKGRDKFYEGTPNRHSRHHHHHSSNSNNNNNNNYNSSSGGSSSGGSSSSSSESSSNSTLGNSRSYFFGAYIFSDQPPFKLLYISPMPIMTKQLYTGRKARKYNIEVVVFPTSLFLEGNTVVLSGGFNDEEAIIMRMDLTELIDSLIPVAPY